MPAIVLIKERSSERVDYDQFLPRNGLYGSLQRFFKHFLAGNSQQEEGCGKFS